MYKYMCSITIAAVLVGMAFVANWVYSVWSFEADKLQTGTVVATAYIDQQHGPEKFLAVVDAGDQIVLADVQPATWNKLIGGLTCQIERDESDRAVRYRLVSVQ